MFRRSTQDKLDKKRFADDDRRHMISVLGHVVCAHIEKATTDDCKIVSEALVRKYPFLKEHVMDLISFYLLVNYFFRLITVFLAAILIYQVSKYKSDSWGFWGFHWAYAKTS